MPNWCYNSATFVCTSKEVFDKLLQSIKDNNWFQTFAPSGFSTDNCGKKWDSFDIEIGNLDAKRDWGHAKDFVEGMWKMLQYKDARDWVLATGKEHSVRECIEYAFSLKDIIIRWEGSGDNEIGVDTKTNKTLIKINPIYYRPAEVETLLGDPTDAKTLLKWEPTYSFEKIIEEMINFDLRRQ